MVIAARQWASRGQPERRLCCALDNSPWECVAMDDVSQSQWKSLTPATEFSRRGFVVTTLTAGFALAVQPVSAETITTDSNGLAVGEVKIPVTDGEIPAYRAMPAKG